MDPKLAWYVARSTGIVAWALLTLSVVWGLLLSTRILRGTPTPRWLLDLHRFLGALTVAFTAVHLGALVADSAVPFGVADVVVPFASAWRPGAVAAGIAALYLLLAVEITSLLMRRLPRVWWRRVHMSSFVAFWAATLHGVTAGADAGNRVLAAAYQLAAIAVTFLCIYRITAGRAAQERGRPRSAPAGTEPRRATPATARPVTSAAGGR